MNDLLIIEAKGVELNQAFQEIFKSGSLSGRTSHRKQVYLFSTYQPILFPEQIERVKELATANGFNWWVVLEPRGFKISLH